MGEHGGDTLGWMEVAIAGDNEAMGGLISAASSGQQLLANRDQLLSNGITSGGRSVFPLSVLPVCLFPVAGFGPAQVTDASKVQLFSDEAKIRVTGVC